MKKQILVYLLIAFLLGSPPLVAAAPNKVYMLLGTRLTFTDTGSTGGNIDLSAMASGTGKYSDRYDKNALASPSGALPYLFRWDLTVQLNGTNVIGDVLELYIVTSNGTQVQGNLGTTKGTLATDKRKNLTLAGLLVVDQTTSATTMMASGYVEIRERYLSVALWNGSSLALVTSTSVHSIGLTPHTVEIQAAIPLDYDNRTAVPPLAFAV